MPITLKFPTQKKPEETKQVELNSKSNQASVQSDSGSVPTQGEKKISPLAAMFAARKNGVARDSIKVDVPVDTKSANSQSIASAVQDDNNGLEEQAEEVQDSGPEKAAVEIPLPAGAKAIPADEVAAFKESLQVIKDHMENPDMVGQALRKIMLDLQGNPNLIGFLKDEDAGLMVRGLRVSCGNAVIVKSKAKRTKKDVPATGEVKRGLDDLSALLASI